MAVETSFNMRAEIILFLPHYKFDRSLCGLQEFYCLFVVFSLDGDPVDREKLVSAFEAAVTVSHAARDYSGIEKN